MNFSKIIVNFFVTCSILLSGSVLASERLPDNCLASVVSVNCLSSNQTLTEIEDEQTALSKFVSVAYQANSKKQRYTSIEFPQPNNAYKTTLKNIGVVVSLNWVL